MEIKGTAVKSIPGYVKKREPSRYVEWVKSLPKDSQAIINSVSTATWYSLKDAALEPSKKVCDLFFGSDLKQGAWELGRFSAEEALNGIYKLYVKLSMPGHIINRAGRIMSAYYRPSKMEAFESRPTSVKLRMSEFGIPSDIIEYRIGGWVERALEISGCKGVDVNITKSMAKGDSETIIECSWK